MEYSNPQIPEGINYSKTHPFREFLLLSGGVFGVLLLITLILAFFADKLAVYIPFSAEKDIDIFVFESSDKHPQLSDYLQQLADRIAATQELPPEMKIKVHYDTGDTVNAYATLGGNIVLFKGLLQRLKHENALAMVMAHEIAHIKFRHPIRGMSKGIIIGVALSLINSSLGDSVVESFLGNTAMVGILKYTRDQETEADIEAMRSMRALYGHLYGAADLFKILAKVDSSGFQPEFLRTHPHIADRIKRIEQGFKEDSGSQSYTELPENFTNWLADTAE